MAKDLFPRNQALLNEYLNRAVSYLNNNGSHLGLLPAQLTALNALHTAWHGSYMLSVNAATATTATRQERNAAGAELTAALRGIYRDFPQSILTPEDRAALNLKLRASKYTAAPLPHGAPQLSVRIEQRWRHEVAFREAGQSGRRGKPAGVRACQIWMKIGQRPIGDNDMRFVCAATRAPYTVHFDDADKGKQVYYWARWENSRGQCGPWSAEVEATIAG